jgi:hypothetical protein
LIWGVANLRSKFLKYDLFWVGYPSDSVAKNAIFVVFGHRHAMRPAPSGVLGDPTTGAYNSRAGCPGMLTG